MLKQVDQAKHSLLDDSRHHIPSGRGWSNIYEGPKDEHHVEL
jgi:hypothetical protein